MDEKNIKKFIYKCSIPCCKSKTNRAISLYDLTYHGFPNDENLAQMWLEKCHDKRFKKFVITKNTKICSLHFCEKQYIQNANKKQSKNLFKRLKKDVVPCQNLPGQKEKSCSGLCQSNKSAITVPISIRDILPKYQKGVLSSSNCSKPLKNKIKMILPKITNDFVKNVSTKISNESLSLKQNNETLAHLAMSPWQATCKITKDCNQCTSVSSALSMNPIPSLQTNKTFKEQPKTVIGRQDLLDTTDCRNEIQLKNSLIWSQPWTFDIPGKCIDLKEKLKSLKRENELLSGKEDDKTKELESIKKRKIISEKDLNSKINDLKSQKENLLEYKQIVDKYFSPAQLARIKKSNSKKKWDKEDIIAAIGLYCVSKKCYQYVKKKLMIPLPSATTIKRWMAKESVTTGFIHTSFKLLECKLKENDQKSKVLVISFDEMAIKAEYCYDSSNDIIYKPYNKLQVMMVRSLFNTFKIPIYIDFNKPITKEILFESIRRLYNIGYNVKSIVCDQGAENQKLYSSLSVNYIQTYFTNPYDPDEKIYCFFDIPHALKNIRNHILDNGLRLSNEEVLNRGTFLNLLELNDSLYKTCPKFTRDHIYVQGQERQRVCKAAQTISNSVGKAIVEYLPNNREAGVFIQRLDQAFDVLNSRSYGETNPFRKAFGLNIEAQKRSLEFVINDFSLVRFIGKKSLLPCQRSFIMGARATQLLFDDLSSKYGISHFFTSKLNQDVVENLFSKLRFIGNNRLPNPVDCLVRMKIVLFGLDANNIINAPAVSIIEDSKHNETIQEERGIINLPCVDVVNEECILKPPEDLLITKFDETIDAKIFNEIDELFCDEDEGNTIGVIGNHGFCYHVGYIAHTIEKKKGNLQLAYPSSASDQNSSTPAH